MYWLGPFLENKAESYNVCGVIEATVSAVVSIDEGFDVEVVVVDF